MNMPVTQDTLPTEQELREKVADAVSKLDGVAHGFAYEITGTVLPSDCRGISSRVANTVLEIALPVIEEACRKNTRLYERCEEILTAYGHADELQQENTRLKEKLQLFATYTDCYAEPCPMCEYDADGKMVKMCCFHQEIAKLRAEREVVENVSAMSASTVPTNEELRKQAAESASEAADVSYRNTMRYEIERNMAYGVYIMQISEAVNRAIPTYESALDAAREENAELTRSRDNYKLSYDRCIACVDKAFQGPDAILPDYLKLGEDKFDAIVRLAQDYATQEKMIENYAADANARLAEIERLKHEVEAYKKAKAENDERFMLERDEARNERDELQAKVDAVPKKLSRQEWLDCAADTIFPLNNANWKAHQPLNELVRKADPDNFPCCEFVRVVDALRKLAYGEEKTDGTEPVKEGEFPQWWEVDQENGHAAHFFCFEGGNRLSKTYDYFGRPLSGTEYSIDDMKVCDNRTFHRLPSKPDVIRRWAEDHAEKAAHTIAESLSDLDRRIELEALVTEREGMVAENAWRVEGDKAVAYGEEAFNAVAEKIRALKGSAK